MKLGNFERLLGDRSDPAKENNLGGINLAARSFANFNPFALNKTIFSTLFRKRKPPDLGCPSLPTDLRAIKNSLKRGENKISRLEGKIKKLEYDKLQLNAKVSDQTREIKRLTKTNSNKRKEIVKLEKVIVSQKLRNEEITTNCETKQNTLVWFNRVYNDLAKLLENTRKEVLQLRENANDDEDGIGRASFPLETLQASTLPGATEFL